MVVEQKGGRYGYLTYEGETLEMQPPFVLRHALNPFRQPVNIPRVINLPLAHSMCVFAILTYSMRLR